MLPSSLALARSWVSPGGVKQAFFLLMKAIGISAVYML